MREQDALEIIKALADGVDPISGKVFPADSPYQNAQITRALCAAATTLEKTVKIKNRKLPERAGKPWDKEESDAMAMNFDKGMKIGELAKEHKRTHGAIVAQLAKLGKIEPTYQRR